MRRLALLAAALAAGCVTSPPPQPAPRPARKASTTPPPKKPAPAPSPAPSGPGPITATNWRSHPSVEAVRRLVADGDAALAAHRWTRTQSQICAPERSPRGYGLERTVVLDERGKIRRYVVAEGDDHATFKVEHHYDEAGRLRYAVGTAGADTGASERATLFMGEDGGMLWIDRSHSGPTYAFPVTWPEGSLVRDPSKDFVAPGPKGCRGR